LRPWTRRRARLASCRVASGGAADYPRDLVERHGEHVVEHEREPLGGSQRLEHDEQRHADRVGKEGLVLGVGAVGAIDDRLRQVHAQRLLAPHPAGAQHVQRHAPDDGGQPGAEVLDVAGVRAAEPQPRFLNGVVCLAQRAQHPVGHRPEPGAALLESFRHPVALIHWSQPSVASGHPTRPA
jgi:hypothetical protein